jgi:hypothetical protein
MLGGADEPEKDFTRVSRYSGGCNCGRVRVQVLAREDSKFISKACSCGFCRGHAAVMLSAPDGLMLLGLPPRADTYNCGFGITEFHVCGNCGVFVAATWPDGKTLLGAANLLAIEHSYLDRPLAVDFDKETIAERQARKRQTWMPATIVPATYMSARG